MRPRLCARLTTALLLGGGLLALAGSPAGSSWVAAGTAPHAQFG